MLRGMRRDLVASVLLAIARRGLRAGPDAVAIPPSAAPTSAPVPSPTPTGTRALAERRGPALTWVGDPITVAEAIDRRDHRPRRHGARDRGVFVAPGRARLCPLILPASPAMEPARTTSPGSATAIRSADRPRLRRAGPARDRAPDPARYVRPDRRCRRSPAASSRWATSTTTGQPTARPSRSRRAGATSSSTRSSTPTRPHLDRNAIESFRLDPGARPVATAAEVVKAATGLPEGDRPDPRRLGRCPDARSRRSSRRPRPCRGSRPSTPSGWSATSTRTDNRPVVRTLLVLDGPDGSFFGNVYAVTPEAVVKQ